MKYFLKAPVDHLRVGDRDLAHQSLCFRRADRLQLLIDRGIDAADKERRDGGDPRRVGAALQAFDICARYRLVVRHRKHQGHVDVDAFGNELLNGRNTLRGSRHFDQQIGPTDRAA